MTKTENKSYLQCIILAYMCKYKLIEKQTEQKLGVCDTALTTQPIYYGLALHVKKAARIKFIYAETLPKITHGNHSKSAIHKGYNKIQNNLNNVLLIRQSQTS